MQPTKPKCDDVPSGPLTEHTLERWNGVESVQVPLAPQSGADLESVSPHTADDSYAVPHEPPLHWSAHIETWIFRLAVVAGIAGVLYVAVTTLLLFRVIR